MFIKHCAILLVQTSNIFDPFEMSVESSPHRRKRFCGISILFQQEQTKGGLLKAEKDFVNILIDFSNFGERCQCVSNTLLAVRRIRILDC